MIQLQESGKISSSAAKEIVLQAMKTGKSAQELMESLGLEQKSDTGQITAWVEEVIAENPKVVEDIKAGKEKGIQFLMGQVMKKSRGSANPPIVMQILKEKLS